VKEKTRSTFSSAVSIQTLMEKETFLLSLCCSICSKTNEHVFVLLKRTFLILMSGGFQGFCVRKQRENFEFSPFCELSSKRRGLFYGGKASK
jgi:hypothetical protein